MPRLLIFLLLMCVATRARGQDDWLRNAFKSGSSNTNTVSKPQSKVSNAEKTPSTSDAPNGAAGAAEEKKEERKLRPELLPSSGPWAWRILKVAWDETDEKGYEEFIRLIGESECTTVHDCLTSAKANPRFSSKHPPRMTFFADCADLPFVLRAYYAWQVGLPFSFSVRLDHHAKTGGHTTALRGFQVADRYDIVGPGPDPRLALQGVVQFVSSEHFRTPPAYTGKLLTDHYPVSVTRKSIRAGTVIFDPDGHIAVVYKVTDDGRVFYIDSHPDNSLTRGMFNREFSRAEPPMGAGFKRWRPQRLEGARKGPNGTLVGGRIVLTPDNKLPDWSDEQFFGTRTPRPANWKQGVFEVNGAPVDYHDFVRLRLAFPGFKYDPVAETKAMMSQLCRDLRYRVDSVNLAIKAGIHRRPPPGRLPDNIYATKGDWETYSTPSRDARIKTAFEETRDEVLRFLKLAKERSAVLNYNGQNLRADLLAVYREEAAACSITYTKTDGRNVTLGFEEIKRRLFKMSFDPYHCVERRWGADDPAELASCPDNRLKSDWYVAQERLRNQLVRTYGEKMGWSLGEMRNLSLDIGISEAPDIDPLKVLLDENYVVAAKAETGVARGGARQK